MSDGIEFDRVGDHAVGGDQSRSGRGEYALSRHRIKICHASRRATPFLAKIDFFLFDHRAFSAKIKPAGGLFFCR